MASKKKNLYPEITVSRIKNPSRFYAIPVLGWLVKIIMLIPVGIFICILSFANFFIWMINSFYITFTGKYWKVAYDLNTGIIRLVLKSQFFIYGLTDQYPGFSFAIDDKFSIKIPYPKSPSKFFAFPIFGLLVRFIMLIPFWIYQSIISRAASIALAVGSFFVTFTGIYPESDYEINRDAVRLEIAANMWLLGLSDEYPSFWISMNHQAIKIILIILSILLMGANYSSGFTNRDNSRNRNMRQYYNANNMNPMNYYPQQ